MNMPVSVASWGTKSTTYARTALLAPALVLHACFDVSNIDPGAAAPIAPPRLVAPLSAATVTSHRPRLRWALPKGTDGAHVQICRERACANVVVEFDILGSQGAPAVDLPRGVLFWRALGRRSGDAGRPVTGTDVSRTWQFTVGARSAAVNTAWGVSPDVNGDGFADVLVGDDTVYWTNLYLGSAAGLSAQPAAKWQGSGTVFANSGDVNGDGFVDIAPGGFLGGTNGLSETSAGFSPELDDFHLSDSRSVGDVNGDGYGDLIFAASRTQVSPARIFLCLGSASGFPEAVSAMVEAPYAEAPFTPTLAAVGDVNGDSYADFVFVASDDSTSAATVYVYRGSAAGVTTPPDTLTVPWAHGGAGTVDSVAAANDVNGDGYADVIIGSASTSGQGGVAGYPGEVFLYLGGAAGLSTVASIALKGALEGLRSTGFGVGLASGDVNGDGFADLILGASGASPPLGSIVQGRIYVFLGSASGISTTPSASMGNPSRVEANFFGDFLGVARDINGDGYSDVVVGGPSAFAAGSVYVYFGSAAGLPKTPSTVLMGLADPGGPISGFGTFVARVPTNAEIFK